jgi:hypothetical protein
VSFSAANKEDVPPTAPTAPGVRVATGRGISRRQFLRGAGIVLALPLLESMQAAIMRAAERASPGTPGGKPRRLLAICNNLGLLPEGFFPADVGRGYALSPYLETLREHRDDFTVFSGVSHPGMAGHDADICFLTTAPDPGREGFRNSISLDQVVAGRVGHLTRFPSLTLGVNVQPGVRSLSWTLLGTLIPCEEKAAAVFRRMFVQGSSTEIAQQVRRLERGQSILDAVAGQAKALERDVGPRDRDRLDQYFTSVRELEQRMQKARQWELRPKPVIARPPPLDPENPRDYMEKVKLMYDMTRLAFETDSTRSVTLMLDSLYSPAIQFGGTRTSDTYHNLSHHGRSAEKIAQLRTIDQWHMTQLADLLRDLRAVKEDGETLLDRTMVLYGSNLGNANTHESLNLPVLLAGGGFRHGQHLVFDRKNNLPLSNLFVSMLQRMEVEQDRFGSSTGAMRGLEMRG